MTAEQEPTYATAAAVAGLAREVEAMGRDLGQLRELPARVDELARLVAQLVDSAAAAPAPAAAEAPPTWLDLPADARLARSLLHELVAWMELVYLRYADAAAHLPECWLWHPDVIEELVWLMHAWSAAYHGERACTAAAGDWHDRYRPGVVRRINVMHGRCSLENHRPREGRPLPVAPAVPVAEAAEEIGAWWVCRRHTAAPEPSDEQLATAAQRPRAGGRR
jgi:hypothetical protein